MVFGRCPLSNFGGPYNGSGAKFFLKFHFTFYLYIVIFLIKWNELPLFSCQCLGIVVLFLVQKCLYGLHGICIWMSQWSRDKRNRKKETMMPWGESCNRSVNLARYKKKDYQCLPFLLLENSKMNFDALVISS